MMSNQAERESAEACESIQKRSREQHDITKAAAILRAARPEIDAIKAAKQAKVRLSGESHEARSERLRLTRDACELVALHGRQMTLPYKAQQLRSCVEHRGLRVRMADGLAVIYKGA